MLQAHSYPPSVLTHEWLQPCSMEAHSSNSFMKVAEKPAFCTVLSDSKITSSLLEVDLEDGQTCHFDHYIGIYSDELINEMDQ